MEFPKVIEVAGFDYTVTTREETMKVPLKELGYKEKGTMEALGYNKYIDQEIVVCTNVPIDRQKEVLLHEVIHSVVNHYHIPMPEETDKMEEVVSLLSEGMYQVLKNNPEFVKIYLKDQPVETGV